MTAGLLVEEDDGHGQGPLEEAAYALDYGQDRSTLSPEAQVMYDQLVMQDGEPRIGRLPGKEERKQAQQARRERLAVLHSSGVLDDDEFRAAKARIIRG